MQAGGDEGMFKENNKKFEVRSHCHSCSRSRSSRCIRHTRHKPDTRPPPFADRLLHVFRSQVLDGSIEFKVTSVNSELGEFGGVFVHKQPSDTDLGSKVPKELLLKGAFFATVAEQ